MVFIERYCRTGVTQHYDVNCITIILPKSVVVPTVCIVFLTYITVFFVATIVHISEPISTIQCGTHIHIIVTSGCLVSNVQLDVIKKKHCLFFLKKNIGFNSKIYLM